MHEQWNRLTFEDRERVREKDRLCKGSKQTLLSMESVHKEPYHQNGDQIALSQTSNSCGIENGDEQIHTVHNMDYAKDTVGEYIQKTLLEREIAIFNKHIQEVPEYICTCCHRLLYKCTVRFFKECNYDGSSSVIQKALSSSICKVSANGIEYICVTCHNDLRGKCPRLPAQSVANGLELTMVPDELVNLNDLECRFISLCIPFMKILSLPRGGQYGINGPCVNVPAKTTAISNLLP